MIKPILILFILIFSLNEACTQNSNKGIIKGTVIDDITQSPVQGATVEIPETSKLTQTNSKGGFQFTELETGIYQISVKALGFESHIKSELVVTSSKPLEVLIKLNPKGITTDQINVEANAFDQSSDVNLSSINLDYEEIRRAPGATEDISRMLQSAPGVAIGNDQRNDLIIRGGSPAENLILIDGIEIPNINHFGTDGSSSGAIGFINSRFIQSTDMLTGGFPSLYGDKLSGVISINFREGSRKNFFGDVNLSIAGFGAIFEGPLSDKGSYMFSLRRSYLELVKSAIRLTSVPNYWDINLKATYDLSPKDKLTLIGLSGIDKVDFSGESAEDNPYGNSNSNQNTYVAGINYKKLFKKGFLQTVLDYNVTDYNVKQIEGQTAEIRFLNVAVNKIAGLYTDLKYQLSQTFILNTGVGGKFANIDNQLYLKGDTNAAGYVYDTINANVDFSTTKLFMHANLTSKLFKDRINLNTGFRVDYFDYISNQTYFSPRIGMSVNLNSITSLNFAWGIYHQSPEYIWLVSSPYNNLLNNIQSIHYIAGIEHFFASDIKANVEVYYKKYKDYPVWIDIPTYILIDGGAEFGPNLVGQASGAGYGYVQGIDVSIHKKLSGNGLYGMINYSYINSSFTALAGNNKPGAFDPGNEFTLIAGYQFNDGWLAGFKLKYAGGRPYTPINEQASKQVNRAVYATDDFNSARYPYYLRVDVRVDKKFDFKKTNITAYLELQNVFDRQNIYSYYWNEDYKELSTIYQWAFFPVGGISFQF
ncbi:MAG TPA: TonB-dependent receptor [Ignavibacteria bacterium]|nr:TonB-dependent receptor [Ignavibacteria bacterium]HMR41796.1 TonB-dependent receptor [Ignavibacteria bacterium]